MKLFCIFNADGSFNPIKLKNMLHIMQDNNSDLIFASRYEKIVLKIMLITLVKFYLQKWEKYFLISI